MRKSVSLALFAFLVALSSCGSSSDGVALKKSWISTGPRWKNVRYISKIVRGQSLKIIDTSEDGKWYKVVLKDGKTKGWVYHRYAHKGSWKILSLSSKKKIFSQPDINSPAKGTLFPNKKVIVIDERKDNFYEVNVNWRKSGFITKGGVSADASLKDTSAKKTFYIPGIGECQIEASSELAESGGYSYSVKNLFDGKMNTTWQEGKPGAGRGEWVQVTFPSATSIRVSIVNGFNWSDKKYGDLYDKNCRVKTLRAVFWSDQGYKQSSTHKLEDARKDFQDVGVYNNVVKIRFVIDDVYAGSKWQDTAISELKIEKL